mmetsp:Transcript_4512/g.9433  ORF Transcript_4512/g.9433 Transcript_4512/m.9433 type:complete len:98 (+) Transcript_4512:34-327(+)
MQMHPRYKQQQNNNNNNNETVKTRLLSQAFPYNTFIAFLVCLFSLCSVPSHLVYHIPYTLQYNTQSLKHAVSSPYTPLSSQNDKAEKGSIVSLEGFD